MKPALILGLALAANAMATDSSDNNELFVAPTGKLGDLAQRFPGKYIMYDEQADDEFYHGNLPREAFKSDEEYRRYIVKRSSEEADDEFLIRPLVPHISADDEELFVAPRGKLADLAKKYHGMIMFDEQADDELIAMNIPREKFKTEQEWKRYLVSRSEEVADDEFSIRGWINAEEKWRKYLLSKSEEVADDEFSLRHLFQAGQEWKRYLTSKSEEVADDEFFSKTRGLFKTESEWRNYIASMKPPAVRTEKVVHDDELALRNPTPEQYQRLERKNLLYKSAEEADDELLLRPSMDVFKIHAESLKRLAKERVPYDDEELFANHKTKKSKKPVPGPAQEPVTAIELADNELKTKIVHLPPFNHLAYAFDDDELVAVKIPREKLPTEEAYRRHQVSLSEEVAGDELWTTIQSGNRTITIHGWEIQARDDGITDDELLGSNESRPKNQPDQNTQTIIIHQWAMHRGDDEVADDELAFRAPRVFIDRHLSKQKNHTSETRSHLVKPGQDTTIEALVRNDEADDELHYLGQLLKDQVPKPFRRFDDDEFRAKGEKPAHVKTQEMGTEGHKMKRKLRPVVDNNSLAQN